jgi:hypothetical protein
LVQARALTLRNSPRGLYLFQYYFTLIIPRGIRLNPTSPFNFTNRDKDLFIGTFNKIIEISLKEMELK